MTCMRQHDVVLNTGFSSRPYKFLLLIVQNILYRWNIRDRCIAGNTSHDYYNETTESMLTSLIYILKYETQ